MAQVIEIVNQITFSSRYQRSLNIPDTFVASNTIFNQQHLPKAPRARWGVGDLFSNLVCDRVRQNQHLQLSQDGNSGSYPAILW